METTHSFQSHGCDGPPFLLPHHTRCFDAVGMWARSPSAASGTLHGSDGVKAETASMPRINPGAGSELSL
jgi:hypothetical protein